MSETTTTPQAIPQQELPVSLTDSAATKVKELIAKEDKGDVSLRVAVQPGGCSGMRYALFFDDAKHDGDVVGDIQGVPVRVDHMSAPHLQGTVIDWVDSLMGAGFDIKNPNAQSTCACGDSFS